MERKEADPPPPVARTRPLPARPALAAWESNLTSSTSSSSSSSFSPPDFLRHVQAALKRHRPLGMHANGPRARRVLVSSGAAVPSVDSMSAVGIASSGSSVSLNMASSDEGKRGLPSGGEMETTIPPEENASVTPPSSTGRTATEQNGSLPLEAEAETRLACDRQKPSTICRDAQKKVHCSLEADDASTSFQSAAVTRMTNHSRMGDISSHMTSLALAEREGSSGALLDPDLKQQDFLPMEMLGHSMMVGDARLMDKMTEPRGNLHLTDPMTQGSVASSSLTALSLHSGQASQCTHVALAGQTAVPTQMSSCAVKSEFRVQENIPSEVRGKGRNEDDRFEQQGKDPPFDDKIHRKAVSGDAGILHSQVCSIKDSSLNVSMEPSQSTKAEKGSRKKKYDADLFFKVNGKYYQKLGKIGSGGSSEVYKVITSDCTIYALKRIVLKGRDYSTAYGFYQEIEYLKKLKGKSNIIQLIDYEVTNEALVEEVMDTCIPVKNGRIKDDVYIYMVLEYGEIDLAHMLLQKWKEFDRSSWKMDENWLRFYWQQMLEAVNTIHEDRIVHSDLKPANFLLVRGSLKLIDFGIAKAISSDTTNIQRDSQVGTLNYMSPEAYMCNELDANGNPIKCGRSSDIWSLGCILYQMVYGKTPFAEYKTVWAKYKVVTDQNHQIVYEPVSNPWLIDLMRKCLAWDRNERWRIPQLLQHPFLVPPIPQELPPPSGSTWNSLLKKIEVYSHVPEVSSLLGQFLKLIADLEKGSTNSHLQT